MEFSIQIYIPQVGSGNIDNIILTNFIFFRSCGHEILMKISFNITFRTAIFNFPIF